MLISTKLFKETCSIILSAIDNSVISTLNETLELKTEEKTLILNVTNGEYFVSVKFPLESEETLHASVNANLFLKLIAAITTEDIELQAKETYLEVKGNGTYKIPFIFNGDEILNLPQITINNPTVNMKISGEILNSILNFNSKELLRGTISKPVQKMYYLDEKGCITFVSGACVNYFELEKPIRVLFNNRLVKLFKLFKGNMTDFTLGYDEAVDDVQTKVKFETSNISLVAITGSRDDLLKSVPVAAIRGRAEKDYLYNVVLGTQEFRDSINRLLLFFPTSKGSLKDARSYGDFVFSKNQVIIYDSNKENSEVIKFKNELDIEDEYKMTLDLDDLKVVLDSMTEDCFTLSFGDEQAIVIKRLSISNVIPRVRR